MYLLDQSLVLHSTRLSSTFFLFHFVTCMTSFFHFFLFYYFNALPSHATLTHQITSHLVSLYILSYFVSVQIIMLHIRCMWFTSLTSIWAVRCLLPHGNWMQDLQVFALHFRSVTLLSDAWASPRTTTAHIQLYLSYAALQRLVKVTITILQRVAALREEQRQSTYITVQMRATLLSSHVKYSGWATHRIAGMCCFVWCCASRRTVPLHDGGLYKCDAMGKQKVELM